MTSNACRLKTALRARGALDELMRAGAVPRQAAPTLARGAIDLRQHVRPTAFGNALGESIAEGMQPKEPTTTTVSLTDGKPVRFGDSGSSRVMLGSGDNGDRFADVSMVDTSGVKAIEDYAASAPRTLLASSNEWASVVFSSTLPDTQPPSPAFGDHAGAHQVRMRDQTAKDLRNELDEVMGEGIKPANERNRRALLSEFSANALLEQRKRGLKALLTPVDA